MKIFGKNIDDVELSELLNETELEEKKKEKEIGCEDEVDWNHILQEIKSKNIHFIKNLISSKEINVNAQNPSNGKTLLIHSVIIGDLELTKTVCNFGADVNLKDMDGLDALDYAVKFGRYKITELLFYRTLSGSLGNDLKNISMEIHQKNKEAQYIYKSDKKLPAQITKFMIKAIKERATFDHSMFYYSWFFEMHKHGENIFYSDLWGAMMDAYMSVLRNTNDKNGWKWLKAQFLPSLIWYLSHPINTKHVQKNQNDDAGKMEQVLKRSMFYELLVRVRKESKRQSDLLLKQKIDCIKTEKPNDWDKLIKYNINTKYCNNARQDVCRCLLSRYNEQELSEDTYPPSTHFSAKKHYDTNIYLNELMFRANILDSMFQNDMKQITKEINLQNKQQCTFRMGPVKTLARAQTKVQNDYINEKYPTSAKILDINRCALQYKSIDNMMQFIKIFTQRINDKNARSIKEIIRVKNGWSVYNAAHPQYTDIKLNVLVQSKVDGLIIAEIQFLLDIMSAYKKKAHKLYAVERKFELVYNFGVLKEEMSKFKDVEDIMVTWREMARNDDLTAFKALWESTTPSIQLLIDQNQWNEWKEAKAEIKIYNNLIFNILTNDRGQIDSY